MNQLQQHTYFYTCTCLSCVFMIETLYYSFLVCLKALDQMTWPMIIERNHNQTLDIPLMTSPCTIVVLGNGACMSLADGCKAITRLHLTGCGAVRSQTQGWRVLLLDAEVSRSQNVECMLWIEYLRASLLRVRHTATLVALSQCLTSCKQSFISLAKRESRSPQIEASAIISFQF